MHHARSGAMRRRGARLRLAFAHFFAKANVHREQCLSSDATRLFACIVLLPTWLRRHVPARGEQFWLPSHCTGRGEARPSGRKAEPEHLETRVWGVSGPVRIKNRTEQHTVDSAHSAHSKECRACSARGLSSQDTALGHAPRSRYTRRAHGMKRLP